MDKPICVKCKNDMNFYHSMCTFACLKCNYHVRVVGFTEKEALEKIDIIKNDLLKIMAKE